MSTALAGLLEPHSGVAGRVQVKAGCTDEFWDVIAALATSDVIGAGRTLAEALQHYGFPVSDAATVALSDGGSREARALNAATVAFLAALAKAGAA